MASRRQMSKRRHVGLKQIAEETGLSIMTVSRALRGTTDIAVDTKARIEAVAARLKYRPNLLIRGVQTGKTRTVGVMVPAQDAFYSKILSGIHDELVAADHVPIVLWSGVDARGNQGATELEQIHRLVDRRVDAVILKPVEDAVSDVYLHEVWDRNIPLVAVDRELPQTRADFIGNDDIAGSKLATDHLLSLGHRRLVHLNFEEPIGTFRDRERGFEQAVKGRSDLAWRVLKSSFFLEKSDEQLAEPIREMLKGPNAPTGFFTAHDRLAVLVCEVAKSLNLQVPLDISVVGFADLEAIQFYHPRLTTVRQDPYTVGRLAAQTALQRSNNPGTAKPIKTRLMPELILRESTAAARS